MKPDCVQTRYQSAIGSLYLVSSAKGLVGLHWNKQLVPLVKPSPDNFFNQTIQELEEYFQGKRTTFTVPLDLRGTEFQKSVWKQLQKIPYGATATYSEIAKKIKKTTAVRAVGAANGKNPLCVLIPCHRVIGSNGSLTGFSGGLKIKQRLLDLEYEK
jgi:methylated-DNA-[protein]-cysteine S-methyltransferase